MQLQRVLFGCVACRGPTDPHIPWFGCTTVEAGGGHGAPSRGDAEDREELQAKEEQTLAEWQVGARATHTRQPGRAGKAQAAPTGLPTCEAPSGEITVLWTRTQDPRKAMIFTEFLPNQD